MRGKKKKELRRIVTQQLPNLRAELLEKEVKRIAKVYKEAQREGKLPHQKGKK
jgi:hypothetical protein